MRALARTSDPSLSGREPLVDALRRLARIAAVFCLVVGGLMLIHLAGARQADPFTSAEMAALKERLVAAPRDEALKEQIRELDLVLRQQYFRHLRRSEAGGWLLLVGLVAWVASARRARRLVEGPHLPRFRDDAADRHLAQARLARQAVAVAGGVTVLSLGLLAIGSGSALPRDAAGLARLQEAAEETGGEVAALPDRETYLANWPRFLGPTGNAVSVHTNIPIRWDVESGENILWKVEVPAAGFNSPIVWKDRVFLSGGSVERREVLAFDVSTGNLRWRQEVPLGPTVTQRQLRDLEQSGFAAPTMATDGLRVYAVFATGDLAAFDLNGRLLWNRALGVPDNHYGHALSLVTHEGRLLLQWDQGHEGDDVSKLIAFDGATGEVAWESRRDFGACWATPIVIETADTWQVIAVGGRYVIGYDVRDGTEHWRLDCLAGELAPSPIQVGDLLLATSPSDRVCAMRFDRRGEFGESDLIWTGSEEVPDITTPVATGELVFTLASYGYLLAFDLATGTKLWEHDLDLPFHASPAIVGDRLHVFSTDGEGVVGRVDREAFVELARFNMGEPVHASPAFTPDRMIVRGEHHLFAIGHRTGTGGGGTTE